MIIIKINNHSKLFILRIRRQITANLIDIINRFEGVHFNYWLEHITGGINSMRPT